MTSEDRKGAGAIFDLVLHSLAIMRVALSVIPADASELMPPTILTWAGLQVAPPGLPQVLVIADDLPAPHRAVGPHRASAAVLGAIAGADAVVLHGVGESETPTVLACAAGKAKALNRTVVVIECGEATLSAWRAVVDALPAHIQRLYFVPTIPGVVGTA